MRKGVLYRADDPIRLTPAGRATVERLALAGVIDLRQADQFARSEPFIAEVRTHHVPLVDQVMDSSRRGKMETAEDMADLYVSMYDRGGQQLVKAIELIAAQPDSPWLVHCAAGKDRTGILVAAMKIAIGVSRDDILAEYVLSDGPAQKRRQLMIEEPLPDDPDLAKSNPFLWTAPAETMNRFLDEIQSRYGTLEAWPEGMGVSVGAVERLNEAWLD